MSSEHYLPLNSEPVQSYASVSKDSEGGHVQQQQQPRRREVPHRRGRAILLIMLSAVAALFVAPLVLSSMTPPSASPAQTAQTQPDSLERPAVPAAPAANSKMADYASTATASASASDSLINDNFDDSNLSSDLKGQLSASQIHALGAEFRSMRSHKGHWDGGEYSQDLDSYRGRKHQLMVALSRTLGQPGVPASDIIATLGEPDEINPVEMSGLMMPGPADQQAQSYDARGHKAMHGAYNMVYYWRNRHDYVWFKIDSASETTIEHGWFAALD
ncbi:hypothetical protein BC831DRAFT_418250 [Entophlyctis helioformis]|nr:hypothetical protein BC831DRAFT_418250 [Entophlyctis helioformis]